MERFFRTGLGIAAGVLVTLAVTVAIPTAFGVKPHKVAGKVYDGIASAFVNDAGEMLGDLIGVDYTGLIDANGTVRFTRDSIAATTTVAGEFMFLEFEHLYVETRFGENRLAFDTLYGTVFGNCTFDGSGDLDLSGSVEQYRMQADIRNFNLNEMLDETFESDLMLSKQGKMHWEITWKDGLLTNKEEQELLYFHFILSKRQGSFKVMEYQPGLNEFTLTPGGIRK